MSNEDKKDNAKLSIVDGVKLGFGGCVVLPLGLLLAIGIILFFVNSCSEFSRQEKINECKQNGGWFCEFQNPK